MTDRTFKQSVQRTFRAFIAMVAIMALGCQHEQTPAAGTGTDGKSAKPVASPVEPIAVSWGLADDQLAADTVKLRIAGQQPAELVLEDDYSIGNDYFCPDDRSFVIDAARGSTLRVLARAGHEDHELFSGVSDASLRRLRLPEDADRLTVELGANGPTQQSWTIDLITRQIGSDHMPLSHVILDDVDLFDGDFFPSTIDIELKGFGPSLEFERGYDADSGDALGLAGRGWTTTAESRVSFDSCGRLAIHSENGGTQHFRREAVDGESRFVPLFGFHTIVRPLKQGGYAIYAKNGYRYDYKEPDGTEWRLSRVVDTNGNEIRYVYETLAGRKVLSAASISKDRELKFRYLQRPVQGAARDGKSISQGTALFLSEVLGPDGWKLKLTQDDRGNLVRVVRSDQSGKGPTDTQYVYQDVVVGGRSLGSRLVEMRDGIGTGRRKIAYEGGRELPVLSGEVREIARTRVVATSGSTFGDMTFVYDTVEQPHGSVPRTVIVRSTGLRNKYLFNSLGLPVERHLGSVVSTSEYGGLNLRLVTRETDGNGLVTTFEYDEYGNRIFERRQLDNGRPIERSWRYVDPEKFSELGIRERVAEEFNWRGIATLYRYDPRGNRKLIVRGDFEVALEYGPRGELVKKQSSEGREWRYTYDDWGYLASEAGSDMLKKGYEHDARGRMVAEIDHAETRRRYQYDARDRWTERTKLLLDEDDFEIRKLYDDATHVTTTVLVDGRMTKATYDALDHLIRYEDGDGRVSTKTYDRSGNLTRDVDGSGKTTDYEYDSNQWMTVEDIEDGARTEFQYDRVGNILTRVIREGDAEITWEFRYEHPQYKPTWARKSSSTGVVTTLHQEFDDNGNRTAVTNEMGERVAYEFDDYDREIR
ncbi:hypothetical protein C7S18_19705 [Ahniella affigens]|uniref:RHS repeat protein n=1 Tax=Ahniella affigens TaxID=2021234 RepID=A0A2P1PWP7_9GAMM|nr:DUF6531 domain-containing protein [Ahniella affigens]AVP99252.1 hypothetical protein C7S18_19705 [Ahniella affigens]